MIPCNREGEAPGGIPRDMPTACHPFAPRSPCRGRRRAFTLVELLVSIAIIAVLLTILLPSLSGARRRAKSVLCLTRLRELGRSATLYAQDYDGRCMPLAYWTTDTIGAGPQVFWWGTNDPAGVDAERGFLYPYLRAESREDGPLECPMQPWGGYLPQSAAGGITSTYGYNGYYLSPAQTPGWGFDIGHRPWRSISSVRDSARTFMFADTMIDFGADQPLNNALLDPPQLYSGGSWSSNSNPTTSFRHDSATQVVHVDGHASGYAAQPAEIVSPRFMIGSVGAGPGPHYVPDWRDWIPSP